MDVDATLVELRALISRCQRTGYGDTRPEERDGWAEDSLEALEMFAVLDEFLSRGGYLPTGWAR